LGELVKIPDKVEQTYYLEKLANVLGVSEQILRESMPKGKTAADNRVLIAASTPSGDKRRSLLLAERLLALLLKYPQYLGSAIDYLEPFMISEELPREIYKSLVLYYNKAVDKTNLADISANLLADEVSKKRVEKLLLLAEKDFGESADEEVRGEIMKNARAIREDYILGERKRLEGEMKKAEESGNAARISELAEEFNKLVNI
jgi:hypothetical protein